MQKADQSIRLFLYGTLKRGYCRHAALRGQTFLGNGRTAPSYRLYDIGDFPGMVDVPRGRSIEGEIWEVDPHCLRQLDQIEGVAAGLYRRERVIMLSPFDQLDVWTYLYARDTSELPECGTRWP